VCDWVRQNVKKSDAEKAAHAQGMLNYPKADDQALQERLKMRKEQAGLAHRSEIKGFVDFIDADEKRT
jgi:3-methyladenine DNA glycosylase Tag